jgi:hypothetical protein
MLKLSQGSAVTALALAAALAAGSLFVSPAVAAETTSQKVQYWSAWGGSVGVRWNRDLAGDVGLRLAPAIGRHSQLSWNEGEMFDLVQAGSLDFDVRNGNLRAFVGGALQARGGYIIDTPGGRIDLTNFRLVPRAGTTGETPILDLVSSDGQAWFYIDRLMYELIDNKSKLAVRTMDLRISPALARRIGHPEVADWAIADMEMTTDVVRQGALNDAPRGSTKWHGNPVPGVPGATYQADLFMKTFNTQYMRCAGCTGVGGNGEVVFAPNSTLRNNVNNGNLSPTVAGDPLGTSSALYTADIPWYQKFSGNFPPYNNDQHPYLIWNLYRFNADGSVDQIGRSGVKHAFLTLNTSCIENPGDSHILGRGCEDLYSTGNNDANNSLGPRSEIIPASNVWGRCGSVYDVNCDGVQNNSGYGSYDQRLKVREFQISGPNQTGATYRFESWYLARQDINILNSMASTNATFQRNTTTWSVLNQTDYKLGPAIDRWVNPAAPGTNERSSMVTTPEGSVKVAVKALPLGNGLWRYHYAVMNLDFARARTEGTEPNIRVLSALGFDFIRIPVGTATISDLVFSDGDTDGTNDWGSSRREDALFFTSSARNNALNWGTLFRFSFTANQAPGEGGVALHIAADSARETVEVNGLLQPAAAPAARR